MYIILLDLRRAFFLLLMPSYGVEETFYNMIISRSIWGRNIKTCGPEVRNMYNEKYT